MKALICLLFGSAGDFHNRTFVKWKIPEKSLNVQLRTFLRGTLMYILCPVARQTPNTSDERLGLMRISSATSALASASLPNEL